MPKQKVPKKLADATSKIANLGDFLLNEDGQIDWEIDEIHLNSKSDGSRKVVCRWKLVNNKWVLICE